MIGADFGVFDSISVDTENDFGVIFEFLKEADFKIGEKTWECACGMLVVDEFTTKLKVEFIKHSNALFDFLFLDF